MEPTGCQRPARISVRPLSSLRSRQAWMRSGRSTTYTYSSAVRGSQSAWAAYPSATRRGRLGGQTLAGLGRLVDEDRDAVAHRLRVLQAQRPLVARRPEQALAVAQDDRVDHQPQLVDEPVLEQPLHERGAAVDDDVAVDLPLELLDRLTQVAAQHRCVVPLGRLQGGGHDVLGHAVELV